MVKITLDIDTFKALASDTRLDIIRALDGKKLSLKDLMIQTNLNKATLHEHLIKLNEAGIVKKQEREGHKWVYYKLTWKGESLLHPENTRIVVMFATTFVLLWVGVVQLFLYVKGKIVDYGNTFNGFVEDGRMLADTPLVGDSIIGNGGSGTASPLFDVSPSIPDFIRQYVTRISEKVTNGSINDSYIGDVKTGEGLRYVFDQSEGMYYTLYQDPMLLYLGIVCFIVVMVVLTFAVWRFRVNRTPKL